MVLAVRLAAEKVEEGMATALLVVVIRVGSIVVVSMEEEKFVNGVAAANHMGIAMEMVVILLALAALLPRKPKLIKTVEPKHKSGIESNSCMAINI
ncbi:hypothetical protein CDL12_27112 [Handroanthus impetiginosus]|uniref:Uncharacterized protein n=1 Tax=Handroanthus impetiginosus TaxID=429701 RepID=A0A2G9G5G9_9LAMI|nr:hypothetical protein CDL12_27112 [Handroanthus impetiginosus]